MNPDPEILAAGVKQMATALGLSDCRIAALTGPASQVASLRKMLGLLGNESRADITARDGQLYVGPFKIADLIPLY